MQLMKSIFLGGAAGVVIVSGASAADLAVTKPAPAEYVRVCSAEGSGFFYIPGTETCLRISGRVRFDIAFDSDSVAGDFGYDFETTGRINFDTRTATSLGTLRGFAQLDLRDNAVGGVDNIVQARELFISLAGFTVGRLNSLYGFDDPLLAKMPLTEQVQYLATFGSGFYAGLAVEDLGDGFGQDAGGVLAIGYNNEGTHIRLAGRANTLDAWGVQLQAQQAFGSGTTVFVAADYADTDVWSASLKLTQKFSDQFTAWVGAAYTDGPAAGDDGFQAQIGADYTLVPGFVIGPEVTYRELTDDVVGRLRFQRNF